MKLLTHIFLILKICETPDSEDNLIEIVDSQPGVSCITLSNSDEIISPSLPKVVRQTKLQLKLHRATGEYQNCQPIQFYQVHRSLIYLITLYWMAFFVRTGIYNITAMYEEVEAEEIRPAF